MVWYFEEGCVVLRFFLLYMLLPVSLYEKRCDLASQIKLVSSENSNSVEEDDFSIDRKISRVSELNNDSLRVEALLQVFIKAEHSNITNLYFEIKHSILKYSKF